MPFGAVRPEVLARRLALALLLGSFAPLAGCIYDSDAITGSVKPAAGAPPSGDAELRAYADDCGKRYDANPGEKVVSINYARALRALARYHQAVAVIESAAIKAPKDMDILGAYGKALADDGQLQQAADVLSRSYVPENPDWSDLSAQGSVADQLGDHAAAQEFYLNALKIAPNEPGLLNNLGLSYLLTKQLPKAEQTLRLAASKPSADQRVRANLALVLALEGKFAESEKVAQGDLSQQTAAANAAAVRKMIVQQNSWREIELTDAKRRSDPTKEAPAQGPGD